MTKYEKMKTAYDKMDEIQGSVTGVAKTLRDTVNTSISKVETLVELSEKGKEMEIKRIRKEFGEKFIEDAKRMRDEFDQSVITARIAAEGVLNEQPTKPADIDIKTYERQLNDMKMELLLATDSNSAFETLNNFTTSQNNAYIAQQLKAEFPSLLSNVLGLAGTETNEYKLKLRKTLDRLNDVAITEEQREAARIHKMVEDKFGRDLFLPGGIQIRAIEEAVGNQYASYANRPHYFKKADE